MTYVDREAVSVTRVRPSQVCRCGCQVPLGVVRVAVGGIMLELEVFADGIALPRGASVSDATMATIEPLARAALLQTLAERWGCLV